MSESQADGNWLEAVLSAIPKARVTVFGDFCLDVYWEIDPDEGELSVETGLPVRRVRRQRHSLGGAGNVVANLVDLGVGAVRAVGLVGDDLFGRQMLEILHSLNVDSTGLLVSAEDWQTLAYAKPTTDGREANRIDFGAFNALTEGSTEALARRLDDAAGASDVVILNQQVPTGISPPAMIERLNAIVAGHPQVQFIVDSRHRAELYRGCILKLNAHEAARLAGEPRRLEERIGAADARRLAGLLRQRAGRCVFLTRGADGLVVADGEATDEVPGIQVLGPTDPVGAGDTVTSAIAAALAAGAEPLAAGRLANIAASITVRKLQMTGTANPEEIRSVGPDPDYIYLPELAADPRQARYLNGTEIEVIHELPAGAAVRHAIFDHDGTISTVRQGWEGIMAPMMVRCILGPRGEEADEALGRQVERAVRDLIEETTGAQTLVQMRGLVELVRRFGRVSEGEILDMHGYKAIYNESLMAMVRGRLDRLARGELSSEDFLIRGARRLLEGLAARGVRLYLTSGTDQADLAAEAEALGCAGLFEGRIFGAVGDIRVEAKRAVLERIFREHELRGPEVVAFGDGPVEMREARKRGAIAVGVASDEVRRSGLNAAKRARLIRAGADLIVPDFGQLDRLLGALALA